MDALKVDFLMTRKAGKFERAGRRRDASGMRRRCPSNLLEVLESRTLLTFTSISLPDQAYIENTTNLASLIPADGATLTTLSDSDQTLTFSQQLTAGTVPNTWMNWSSPPYSESAYPRILTNYTEVSPVTITFSKPVKTFGLEIEPNGPGPFNVSMDFYDGTTLIGTSTQTINYDSNARLLAGQTDEAITSVQIVLAPNMYGFALAQPRYKLASADLKVTKTVNRSQVDLGGDLTYTLQVSNIGPIDADNVVVSDPLPPNTTFVSQTNPGTPWSVSTPTPGSGGLVRFTIPVLPTGASTTFTITVNASASSQVGGLMTNTASITSDTHDVDLENNTSSAVTAVFAPDVAINGDSRHNEISIRVNSILPSFINFTVDGMTIAIPRFLIRSIYVDGLSGNDTLTVDNSNGPITAPITYEGGPGTNTLVIQGGTAISDTYAPGPGVGNGTSTLIFSDGENSSQIESISFLNLAPVIDTVAGPLTVTGTPSNDIINYSAAATSGNGLVVVNNFESIEFSSKTSLTLNGVAGDDAITVNNTTTPTGLTALNVVGGLGYDTMVVNASGQPVLTTDVLSTSVNINGSTPVPVDYNLGPADIEQVRVINATNTLTGTASVFTATAGVPFANLKVATFAFSDPMPPSVHGDTGDFAATIDWGDGTNSAGTIVQLAPDTSGQVAFQVVGSHTYTTPGPTKTYLVSVTISDLGSTRRFTPVGGVPATIVDLAGGTTNPTPIVSTANILDAAIRAQGTIVNAAEGTATPVLTTLATFTSNNPNAGTGDFTSNGGSVTVNWGDGTAPEVTGGIGSTIAVIQLGATPDGVTFQITGSHNYLGFGAYPVTIQIISRYGSQSLATSNAAVADTPPLAASSQPAISTTEGVIFSGAVAAFSQVFTDGSRTSAKPLSDFTAPQPIINWGDGTPPSLGTVIPDPAFPANSGHFLITGVHIYEDSGLNGTAGLFPVATTVFDRGGASVTIFNTATVNDVPIVIVGHLDPASDSGKSSTDGITKVIQPVFVGTTEPHADLRLFANGVPIGQTEAASDGSWSVTSDQLADGTYIITATAVDASGNTSTPIQTVIAPRLLIDTVGPRVTDAAFDRLKGTVTYTFQDVLPDGFTPGGSGLLVESLSDAANFSLNRLHARPPGTFIVTRLTAVMGATPYSDDVTAVFNNGRSLKGGTFQIFARSESVLLKGGIQDIAGNALDGEFYGPQSASGNGIPGGDFIANVKSIHSNTFPKSYSGPVTIIGTPQPNDPPARFQRNATKKPAIPSGPLSAIKPTLSNRRIQVTTATTRLAKPPLSTRTRIRQMILHM